MSKIILKKLKEMNTIWHPESTLVFKSKEQQVVIGRWEESAFVELDEVALELCDTWKFKVDESLIEQEEVEQTEEVVESMDMDTVEEEVSVEQPEEVIPVHTTPVNEDTTDVVFTKCYTNFGNLREEVSASIESVFVKISQLSDELQEAKDKLEARDKEYYILQRDFNSIQAKFTTLKSLLG